MLVSSLECSDGRGIRRAGSHGGGIGIDLVLSRVAGRGPEDIVGVLDAPASQCRAAIAGRRHMDVEFLPQRALPQAPFMPRSILRTICARHDVTLLRAGAAVPRTPAHHRRPGTLWFATEEGMSTRCRSKLSLRMKKGRGGICMKTKLNLNMALRGGAAGGTDG